MINRPVSRAAASFDYVTGAHQQRRRYVEAECLGR
jgi:hypothetical protein